MIVLHSILLFSLIGIHNKFAKFMNFKFLAHDSREQEDEAIPQAFVSCSSFKFPCASIQEYEQGTEVSCFRVGSFELRKLVLNNDYVSRLLGNDQVVSSDLEPSQYEGGFKLWECVNDLCSFIFESSRESSNFCLDVKGKLVVELGCGHGLPGILSLCLGAAGVCFQDFNVDVLRSLTAPNILLNSKLFPVFPVDCIDFLSGDWRDPDLLSSLSACFLDKTDVILTSETLYECSSIRPLLKVMDALLSQEGTIVIASKRFYFGVGGGTIPFLDALKEQNVFTVKHRKVFDDGQSNIREILCIVRKHLEDI